MHAITRYARLSRFKKIALVAAILSLGLLSAIYILMNNATIFSTQTAAHSDINLLQSGWNHMPGVTPQSDGLEVTYTNQPIVYQNGRPGMNMPSVNLYGTHLYSDSDYTLTASIGDLQNTAVLQFYQSTPLTQDEFYTLPNNLEVVISDTLATANIWGSNRQKNPYSQNPTLTISQALTSAPQHTLQLTKKGKQLMIQIDDKIIHRTTYHNVLGKEVWFGFSTAEPNQTWKLKKLNILADTSRTYPVNTQKAVTKPIASTGALQSIASQYRSDFQVGAAAALAPSVSDSEYRSILYGGNFGSITTENALKWQFIHPQPEMYDYTNADSLIEIAQQHNLNVHGHTLVFGEANPAWIQALSTESTSDKNNVKKIMLDHITKTVGHFKGRITSWDVVNEPLSDDENVSLRSHKWLDAMGESYIATAFNAAHQADPTAKLYINDYGLEADGERWDAMLALVTKLKSENVPVNGVGFQAHVYEEADLIDPEVLRRHIRELADIGLTARISEMDVYADDGLDTQAQQYRDIFATCFSEPSCIAWTTWGVTDRYNLYLNNNERIVMGQDYLWDKNAQPTSAVTQIRQFLQG